MTTQSSLRKANRILSRQQQIQIQSEQQRIKKAEEEQARTQNQINKTISDISEGKINDISQIPTELRQYLDVKQIQDYISQKETLQTQEQYNLALRVYTGQIITPAEFRNIPIEIREKAQREAENLEKSHTSYSVEGFNQQKVLNELGIKDWNTYSPEQLQGLTEKQLVKLEDVGLLNKQTETSQVSSENPRLYTGGVNIFAPSKIPVSNIKTALINKYTTSNVQQLYTKGKDIFDYPETKSNSNLNKIYFVSPKNLDNSAIQKYQTATYQRKIPTLEEQRAINVAEMKKERTQGKVIDVAQSPLKFLGGEYEFQKRFDSKYPSETPSDVIQREQQTSYSQLFETGAYPSIVRKTAFDLGSIYFKTTDKLRTLGLKDTKYGKPLSEKEYQEGGVLLGGFGLGYAFSPVFATGGTQKEISKQLSKTKFDELGKDLDNIASSEIGASFKASVEREVASKSSTAEQLKTLKKIKDYYKLSDEGYNNMVSYLKNVGIIKEPKIILKSTEKGLEILTPVQPVKSEITLNVWGAPQIKQTGKVVGSSLFDVKETQANKIGEVNWIGELGKQTQRTKQTQVNLLGLSIFSDLAQPQINKSETKQKQETKQQQKQILNSLLRTQQAMQEKTQQRTKQITKQVMKIPTKLKLKTKLKNKFPLIFGGGKTIPTKKTNIYSVFGKRFGRDIPLGKTSDKREAEKILSKYLTSTLSRSGKIFENEKPLSFGELSFNNQFRPSKKSKTRVVQKAEFSLGSGSEVAEIQMFKRRKGKKKTRFIDLFS